MTIVPANATQAWRERALKPLALGAQGLKELVELPPARTFPVSHAVVMALAGVVGLFAGIAAGVFSNFIALFQTLFFRSHALWLAITLQDEAWKERFLSGLEQAHWHREYLAVAAFGVFVSRMLADYSRRNLDRPALPSYAARIRAIGWLFSFGLVLYYPLLVLTMFNRAFVPTHGGLYEALMTVSWPWRVVAPALGGLAAGLLVRYVTPESAGHGVTEVIEALNVRDRRIPSRVAVWKSVVAGLVVGSGGSAGREGPVVQIGGAVSDGLASRFGLPREQATLLLACGGGAGIAASFNSPIGGTFFALEIILGDFGIRSIAPVAFAAVAATITGRTISGAGGEIVRIPFRLVSGIEIGPYLLLGVVAAIVAVAYVRSVHGVEHFFKKSSLNRLRPEFRPMVGGLAVGLLGLLAPRVLGNGYETMNTALLGELSAGTMLAVLVAKIAASGFTLGSGAPGGSFFPAVFMGAMLGGAFGRGAGVLFPSLVAGAPAYAAVGMAAVVAGATNAPLTAILMLFEFTGSYDIILPLMVACTTSVAGAQWVLGGSMYSLKLRERGVVIKDRRADMLRDTEVRGVMSVHVDTIPATATFGEIMQVVRSTEHSAFPVVDASRRLRGLLLLADLRPFIGDEALASAMIAADLCRPHAPFCTPEDNLETARIRMMEGQLSLLPVVDSSAPDVLVGVVSQRDILLAYDAAIVRTPAS